MVYLSSCASLSFFNTILFNSFLGIPYIFLSLVSIAGELLCSLGDVIFFSFSCFLCPYMDICACGITAASSNFVVWFSWQAFFYSCIYNVGWVGTLALILSLFSSAVSV